MNILSPLRPWRNCILLLLLGMISIALGVVQLNSISRGEAGNTYLNTPLPVVIHIVFGIVFNLVAPFQFVKAIRQKWPKVHRLIGRILTLVAIPVVYTALWMNEFFPSYGGTLKYTGIIAYNIVLIGALALAIYYVRRKKIAQHKLWMMRALAAALGPATQRLIIIPVFLMFGQEVLTDQLIGILIWAGLIINLVFVEIIHLRNKHEIRAKQLKNIALTTVKSS
ncbi:membrane protein [Thalassotalea insulae]|uniref:Membrane protein n=1 Tax=Thalassotalea insulae TaxID=2056778 RepID=A0ABQ6GMB2_9GAMM|nr:DUF2306 domain-containing protein [Thalassotalea insulae]GLX77138.1 membrane protein [Thalassotalea insulae]